MAKKLKKAKKGMNPKVKFTLLNAFKGLISNQAVIDGSKDSPWWVAIIFLVFSAFLPLIPTYASLSKTDGASYLAGYNFGLDEQLAHFAWDFKTADQEFKVEGGKLHHYQGTTEVEFVNPKNDPDYFTGCKYEYAVVNEYNNQFDAKFYFWVDENLSTNVNELLKQKYLVKGSNGSDGQKIPEGVENEKAYLPNIVIFTPNTMAVALYKRDTTNQAGTSFGGLDWLNCRTDKGLVELLVGEEASEKWSTLTKSAFINLYREKTLNTFKGISSLAYLNQKNRTKWTNTGIYLGIYVGVIAFLGLMVFILTRGKNNPYKFLNIWECQKISWWGAASPAIIGTLLSLIFSGNAIGQMAFILVVSLRIMWLSMKQLRPVIQ